MKGRKERRALQAKRPIWVHAVSVGEVFAAAPIIDGLLDRHGQAHPIIITTTTPTGSAQVVSRWGERVIHCYAPYDCGWTMKKFIKGLKPQLLIIMETELWPNMIYYAHKVGCKVILANARLSEKSAVGYRRFKPLVVPMLTRLTKVAVQSEADGKRLVELGLPKDALVRTGSIKFDIKVDPVVVESGRALLNRMNRPVWIAASTHPGEDEQVLLAHKRITEYFARREEDDQLSPLLILVPRHPERFDTVVEMSERAGWRVARRSVVQAPGPEIEIYVGDTMGELMALYAMSQVAFVGGSLIVRGGHNILEPIATEVPVVVGPNMYNFQFIYDELQAAGGIGTVADDESLAGTFVELLRSDTARQVLVGAASTVLAANVGALDRLNNIIDSALEST